MEFIAVDCIVNADGSVHIRRIKRDDAWEAVEQGRQWQDENGRHVLIMLQGAYVREALLAPDDLRWRLKAGHQQDRTVV